MLCLRAHTPRPQYTAVQASSLSTHSIYTIYKKYAYFQGPLQFYHSMPKIHCVTKKVIEAFWGPKSRLWLQAK